MINVFKPLDHMFTDVNIHREYVRSSAVCVSRFPIAIRTPKRFAKTMQ